MQELLPPLWRTEMPLVRVIADMELAGLAVNEAILNTGAARNCITSCTAEHPLLGQCMQATYMYQLGYSWQNAHLMLACMQRRCCWGRACKAQIHDMLLLLPAAMPPCPPVQMYCRGATAATAHRGAGGAGPPGGGGGLQLGLAAGGEVQWGCAALMVLGREVK